MLSSNGPVRHKQNRPMGRNPLRYGLINCHGLDRWRTTPYKNGVWEMEKMMRIGENLV
jgi:hypothetical protein